MYPRDVDDREFGPRWEEDVCHICNARPHEDCADDCDCRHCQRRAHIFWSDFGRARRIGIGPEWIQAQERYGKYPATWIKQAKKDIGVAVA